MHIEETSLKDERQLSRKIKEGRLRGKKHPGIFQKKGHIFTTNVLMGPVY